MSYRYTIATGVMTKAQGEDLGRFLVRYAIHIEGLEVWYILKNGRRVLNQPAMDTAKLIAAEVMSPVATAPVAVPVAAGMAALGCVLPVWAPIAALVALVGSIGGQVTLAKHVVDPQAVAGQLVFTATDVSPQRVWWLEYLLGAYCQPRGWQPQQMYSDGGWQAGVRYAVRTDGGQPTPWSEQKGGYRETVVDSGSGRAADRYARAALEQRRGGGDRRGGDRLGGGRAGQSAGSRTGETSGGLMGRLRDLLG